MADIRLHANRNLRRRTLSTGESRGISAYFAFTHGERPTWWDDIRIDCEGEVLGVIENWASDSKEAIVVTSEEVIVLDPNEHRRLRYADVGSISPLEKQPIPEIVRVMLKSGGVFELPVRGRTGAIGDVVLFLLCAVRERSE